MVEVKNLTFPYGKQKVLDRVSFTAEAGQLLSVLGPNGVGKSTLFRCMLGLLTPLEGEILVQGERVDVMKPGALAQKIAYIPQSHDPVFHYSIFDMVLMGTTAQTGLFSAPNKEQKHLVSETLERLGLFFSGRPQLPHPQWGRAAACAHCPCNGAEGEGSSNGRAFCQLGFRQSDHGDEPCQGIVQGGLLCDPNHP